MDGRRFGKLVVTETIYGYKRKPEEKHSRTMCRCACDCGNDNYLVDATNLRSGKTISCGCDAHERSGQKRRIDNTGQRFGKLVVLEMIYGVQRGEVDKVRKRTYCRCRCDCGREVVKSIYVLRRGYAISCGCDSRERVIQANRKDYTGQRFGRLVVLEMLYETGKTTHARCQCDCGNEVTVIATQLTTGGTQSCGCLQRENTSQANTKDFTGYVSAYGVHMLHPTRKNSRGVWLWSCRCGVCGQIFEALPAKIQNGHTTSCGCAIQSAGERFVKSLLDEMNLPYEPQAKFHGCENRKPLRFDFYVPSVNTAIEINGRQHYEPVEFFGGQEGFEDTQRRDKIKADYCAEHGITLLILPYTMSNTEMRQTIQNIKNA